jgi:hypothetical protein
MRKIAKPLLASILLFGLLAVVASQWPGAASAQLGGGNLGRGPSVGGITFLQSSADPSAGGGIGCVRPCVLVRTGTDQVWLKTGSGATAWSQIAVGGSASPTFTTVTASGDITSSAGNLVATLGDVSAGDDILAGDAITATGNVQGAIVRGTTALEYPSNNLAPAVRASDDTDSGFSSSANTTVMWSGGFSWWLTNVGSVQTSNTATVLSTGAIIRTPRTVDIDAVGDTIATSGGSTVTVTLSAGNITPTSTPFLANGTVGQEIWIINGDTADTLTLTDEGGMAGSNLQLGGATRALGPGDGIGLRYTDVPTADWYEIAFYNN